MREIHVQRLKETVKALALDAAWKLGDREQAALRRLAREETSPLGRQALSVLVENFELAGKEQRPLCQDTGLALVFVEVGREARFVGGDPETAINEGVREAWREGRLRASVLDDPLLRRNTGDNTPAIVHWDLAPGDRVRVLFDAKGGGCENCSRFTMLTPAQGRAGVIRFVAQVVRESGGNPCPPLVIGVGLGGSFERACLLAKKALFRPLGEPNAKPHLAELERELLEAANQTGVGPLGLGGTCTALAVHVEAGPCHIASLPVAVNLDCHSHRHEEAVL